MNVLYVLVEDIKNNLKLFKNTHVFETEYFGENLLRPQRMVAELRLTDPLPELAVGGVLELELGASRSESYFFEKFTPLPVPIEGGLVSFLASRTLRGISISSLPSPNLDCG